MTLEEVQRLAKAFAKAQSQGSLEPSAFVEKVCEYWEQLAPPDPLKP